MSDSNSCKGGRSEEAFPDSRPGPGCQLRRAGPGRRACAAQSYGYSNGYSPSYAPACSNTYANTQYSHSPNYQTRYEWWAGGYWYGRYYAAGYYPVRVEVQQQHCPPPAYAPPAAKVVLNPDVYFSTSDDYRNKVLLDAVAGRVQELLRQSSESRPAATADRELILKLTEQIIQQQRLSAPVQAPAPAPAPAARPAPPAEPMPPASSGRRELKASRYQSAALSKVLTDHCVKCHGPTKQDAGLALVTADGRIADIPARLIEKAFRLVTSGAMPQKAKPLANHDVELFYAWAEAAEQQSRVEWLDTAVASADPYAGIDTAVAWDNRRPLRLRIEERRPRAELRLEVDDDHHRAPLRLEIEEDNHRPARLRLVEDDHRPALKLRLEEDRRPRRRFLRPGRPLRLEIGR